MHIGFLTVHPVTVPIAPDLVHAISCAINQAMLVYSGIIKPEIMELQEVVKLL